MYRYRAGPTTEINAMAAHLGNRHRLPTERLCCGRAERHDDLGFDQGDFLVQPPSAGLDLASIRFLMDSALAARLEFEMLHRIGDIDVRAVDAGFFERRVEHFAGRADERLAAQIF